MSQIESLSEFVSYKFITVLLVLVMYSCVPGKDPVNPADYESYISISADKYPAVSPDGASIAFYHESLEYPEPQEYPTGLYVMNIEGSSKRLLLKGSHWNPRWSPDGQWIIFTSDGTLQIINLSGDSIRTFPGVQDLPLYSPDWSHDGLEILFSSPLTVDGGVFKMSPDFLNIRRVLNPLINNGMYASWSPDRSQIVYEKGGQLLKSVDIYIIDTALIAEKRLTNDKLDDRDPKWSPDSQRITWTSNVHIMVMNISGSDRRTLDYGNYPSWSPLSDYVIYSNANGDFSKEVIWKINIDGSNKYQITY